jgi:hypothetical protein
MLSRMAALISADLWMQSAGQEYTGDDLDALTAWCGAVESAVRKFLRPYSPDPKVLTDHVMDCPTGNVLTLPVLPVRTLTSIHWLAGANGDATLLDTADNLLTANTDYWMPVDPFDGVSRTGKVYRRGRSSWSGEQRYPNRRSLAPVEEPGRGELLINAACGEAAVREEVTGACVLMVSHLMQRRKTGAPYASESWNGYSRTSATPFLVAALYSPDVQALLNVVRPTLVHCAED